MNRRGFTLIELLIVVVIIGLLASIAIPRFSSIRERAFVSALQSDLRNLQSLQEIRRGDPAGNFSYSDDPEALGFVPSRGVTVSFGVANSTGWSAGAVHSSLPAATEAVVSGLQNEREYMFRVKARNSVGVGPASAPSNSVIPTAPVPDAQGDLPALTPREAVELVGGQFRNVTVEVVRETVLRLGSEGLALDLSWVDRNGDAQALANSGSVLAVDPQGSMETAGVGFEPGTVASVYLFEAPRLLGQVRVREDGTFEGVFPLAGEVEAGFYTVQVNGIDAAGRSQSLALGIQIVSPPSAALEVVTEVSDPDPELGQTITITVTVSNIGGLSAPDVVVLTESLKSPRLRIGSVFVDRGEVDAERGVWSVGSLSAGGRATMIVEALVVTPGEALDED